MQSAILAAPVDSPHFASESCESHLNTESQPSGTIRLDHPTLQYGVHYCEFVTDEFLNSYFQDDSWQLVVGIVADTFDFHNAATYIGSDAFSFGYVVQTGQTLRCSALRDYAPSPIPGGRIGIMVNFHEDEISFFRNGEDLGIAFKGFTGCANHFYFGLSVVQQFSTPAIGTFLPCSDVASESRIGAGSNSSSSFLKSAFDCSKVQSGGEQSLSMDLVKSTSSNSLSTLSSDISDDGEFGSLSCSSDSASPMDTYFAEAFQFEECPEDIKLEILSRLTIPDLKRTRLVSKSWRQSSNEDFVWGRHIHSVIPNADSLRQANFTPYFDMYSSKTMKFTDKSLGIDVTNNGRTIVSSETVSFWAASQLEYPKMTDGVHYCEFKVDAFRHGSIGNTWKVVIGVVSDAFDYQLTKWVGVDEKSFGYIAQNGKKVGPSCKNQGAAYGEGYKEDDVIGVLLDITNKKIKFFKNGHCMGTAFADTEFNQMKGHSYHFAVSLARPGMSVTAQNYEYLGNELDTETFDPKSLQCAF